MPKCVSCEIDKTIEEMGVRKKDTCKRCIHLNKYKRFNSKPERKEYNKSLNKKRSESGYNREYYRRNPENSKIRTERSREFRKKNPDKIKNYLKLQKIKFPEKVRAGNLLRIAVFKKKIQKPKNCQKCNYEAKRIEGHHEDYSKPLEVVWLCVSCHKNLHMGEVKFERTNL